MGSFIFYLFNDAGTNSDYTILLKLLKDELQDT
jgi:hypothetical protein